MPFTLEDPTAAHPTSERLSECIHPSHGRIFNSHYRFHSGKGKVTSGLTARDNATTKADKSFEKNPSRPACIRFSPFRAGVCARVRYYCWFGVAAAHSAAYGPRNLIPEARRGEAPPLQMRHSEQMGLVVVSHSAEKRHPTGPL